MGCILAIAFFANFPALEVTRPEMTSNGNYGPHFDLIRVFEHGWPETYVRRDRYEFIVPVPTSGSLSKGVSPWQPWRGGFDFSLFALAIDFTVWIAILLAGAIGTQCWRSRRRALWQPRLIDLLALLAIVAGIAAVSGHGHHEHRRETARLATLHPDNRSEFGAPVPAWWPKRWRERYRHVFGRVQFFNGDPAVACEFPKLMVLEHSGTTPFLADHLRGMPQLEALDAAFTGFRLVDDPESHTSMRDLPPMPNLRGINLYGTDTTDADLVWLSKCPRLEVISISGSPRLEEIGDAGMQHFLKLDKLRILDVAGCNISDEGCQTLARISSLEELHVSGDRISDEGIMHFARLKWLRQLNLYDTKASSEGIEKLRHALPDCSMYLE